MDLHLPPMKRYTQAYRNRHPPPPSPPPPPPPPPPPSFVAVVPQRRRTPCVIVTFRYLLDTHGTMSNWRRRLIWLQNLGGFQDLRTELYAIAGANNIGVIHDHQAVIYYLTRQQLLLNPNQPFRLLVFMWNWNAFANSVARFRIDWVPLNTNQNKRSPNQNKRSPNQSKRSPNQSNKSTSRSRNARYPNARSFIFC